MANKTTVFFLGYRTLVHMWSIFKHTESSNTESETEDLENLDEIEEILDLPTDIVDKPINDIDILYDVHNI